MNIFIIGFGNMGSAIAKSLLKEKKYEIFVASRSKKTLPKGIFKDNSFQNLRSADYVLVAVKPQDIVALAKQIKHRLNKNSVVVSIAAGMRLEKLQRLFEHKRIIRMMPSLTIKAGQGVAFWKASPALTTAEKRRTVRMFDNFTENFEVKNENLIDAGSIIYGSAPAYFFLLAHHIEQAGIKLGISPRQSRRLVEKTFAGSAILQKGQNYQKLIESIASKKGITEAALKVFENKAFGKIIAQAVAAGYKRTKELNNG